ncbi:hypothetical protein T4C_8621 [Trichinella pseudospiralis]|uniref:Uncharacterized protein n=1 Tax=Trichinella pseudospiralis TaxID=6337 RepID=A0A0V1JPL9_TRIPS|nr:hypothetical protein T4D_14899 [Trichinella pseudospiralis]KRZ36913.1 hypothetical protein T4C_8621 [Trichinella pseudospiralis]
MISEHQEPLTIERQMSRYVKIGAEVAASERQTPPGNLVSISTQRLILVTDVDQALGPYQSSQGCLHETLKGSWGFYSRKGIILNEYKPYRLMKASSLSTASPFPPISNRWPDLASRTTANQAKCQRVVDSG